MDRAISKGRELLRAVVRAQLQTLAMEAGAGVTLEAAIGSARLALTVAGEIQSTSD